MQRKTFVSAFAVVMFALMFSFSAYGDVVSVTDVTGTFGYPTGVSSDPAVALSKVGGPPDQLFIQIADNSTITMALDPCITVDSSNAISDMVIDTYDDLYRAAARIEVSEDNVNWVEVVGPPLNECDETKLYVYDDLEKAYTDLSQTGLTEVCYVRMTDYAGAVDGDYLYPTLGFDLDAIYEEHQYFSNCEQAVEPVEPVPFVCDGTAYTVRATPGEFFRIDQSVTPFIFHQIGTTLQGPFGASGGLVPIQVNNLGYRPADDLVYGVALKAPMDQTMNYGLVKIDSLGNVFPVSTNPPVEDIGTRFLAGDIDPDLDVMYLNTYPAGHGLNKYMYIVNLSTGDRTELPLSLPAATVNVADWAVNPIDGKLYGADGLCNPNAQIYQLDPDTGSVTNLGNASALPCSNSGDAQYYGGAWFNAEGRLFVYRNNDWIYQIDLGVSPPAVLSGQQGGAGSSQFNDAAACAVYDNPGPPSADKFYTYTNNNWAERCVSYEVINEVETCVEYRPANIDLDDGVFAPPLPQNGQDQFVLLGKQLGSKKTVVNPGQYFAVVNVDVPVEQDVLVEEDFSGCLGIGTVNPYSVPGGVQVVLIDESGDVYQIDGDLANNIGGYIELSADNVKVFVEAVPAGSTLRVMIKFKPSNALDIIGDFCTNTADISEGEESPVDVTASAGLVIEPR